MRESSASYPGDDVTWDLIVVGGGVAGLVAANRAKERGRSVLLLEKGEDEIYPCNTRFSGGAFHIAMRDIFDDASSLYATVMEVTDGWADPDLLTTLIERAVPTVRWLQARGIRFGRVPAINQQNVLLPLRPNRPGAHWRGRGGDVMVRELGMQLESKGGRLLRGLKATSLQLSDGAVTGLRAERCDGSTASFSCKSVLLADGGYQASAELLELYGTGHGQHSYQRNARTGTGDGIRMAQAVGAALRGIDGGFYGHLLSREVFVNENLWPFPILDFLASAGILVDDHGKRFCDETEGGVYTANAVARLTDAKNAYVIFDSATWATAGAHRAIPPNPHLILAGGTMASAPTVRELAQAIGLPVEQLEATVQQFNEAVINDTTADLHPPRKRPVQPSQPLRSPPFYAIPTVAGITYTMGGLAIDSHARVLRPDGTPITGLYAAGATTGGLEGGPRSGYVGGLMKSAVFGWVAGDGI